MVSATLDPRFFAAPLPTASADDFRAFVISLLNWSRFADEPMARVWISKRTAGCLFADNRYPLSPALRDAMKGCGVFEYDVNTIKLVADKLLRLSPSFEENCSFEEVLHSSLNSEPDLLLPGDTPHLSEDAGRCLVILTILSSYCSELLTTHRFATQRLTRSATIRVTARVDIVEHSRPDLQALQTPSDIQGEIQGCPDFDGFLLGIDAPGLLLAAKDNVQGRFAIRVFLHQSRVERGQRSDWFVEPDFMMSAEFLGRTQECCAADKHLAGLILQSSAEAIDRYNLQKGHPIRTKEGGNAPDVVIDGHKAQRHNISAYYHLHYWDRADDRIELAWVSYPHKDMTITNPQ